MNGQGPPPDIRAPEQDTRAPQPEARAPDTQVPQNSTRSPARRGDARHLINERALRDGPLDDRDMLNEHRARLRQVGEPTYDPNQGSKRHEEEESSTSSSSVRCNDHLGNVGFITPFSEEII